MYFPYTDQNEIFNTVTFASHTHEGKPPGVSDSLLTLSWAAYGHIV